MPSGTPISFSVSYDQTAKMVCVGVWFIPLVGVLFPQGAAAGLLVSVLLISLVAFTYSPRGYVVSAGGITVKRLIGNVFVPRGEVREIRPATGEDIEGAIRVSGSGGLFGYYGLFRTPKLGRCRLYLTDRSKIVVLVTGSHTTLFSPDDVTGFVRAIRAAAPVPVGPVREQASAARYEVYPEWARQL